MILPLLLALSLQASPKAAVVAATYAEARTGIKADLLLAIAHVETRFNHKAVGSVGELGMLQLRPEYHGTLHMKDLNLHFMVAAVYLKQLKKSCSSLGPAWFICYNLGPNGAKRHYRSFVEAVEHGYYRKVTKARMRYVPYYRIRPRHREK